MPKRSVVEKRIETDERKNIRAAYRLYIDFTLASPFIEHLILRTACAVG
tara:strand:+ start:1932 stop:2078 length:147 start_codon:yes stop_codon:yes gene_type:complete